MGSATKSLRHLNQDGTYVVTMLTFSLFGAMLLSLFSTSGKKAKFVGCVSKREDLNLIGNWLKEKNLKIDVDSTFPIKDLPLALERQKSKNKVGRVVIKVEGGW